MSNEHPFGQGPIMCRKHPEREAVTDPIGAYMCAECYEQAWNAGARMADATWHKRERSDVGEHYDERSTDDRSIRREWEGGYVKRSDER